LSEYEAHPVAVLEALSVRCAVLVSDTSGLRELAQKGFCRSIPLDASLSAVAAVIAEQLQSEQQIPRLMLPDWDTCARELITIYEAVVKSPHRSVRVAGGDQFVNRRSELGRRGS
jgi:glycosyltransferase involved in cell wall biosynthesis